MGNSPHTVSIHILDDDSLLNIFCLYRPYFLGEETGEYERLYGGKQRWAGDAGGLSSHTFVKDGETSYLDHHPTYVFHSSVQKARPLQICWHIHLPFLSRSITVVAMAFLLKMKRG